MASPSRRRRPYHVPRADGPASGARRGIRPVRDRAPERRGDPRAARVRCRGPGAAARRAGAGAPVLSLPPSVRLFVATQPIDGRKGPDSLMALVRDVLRHDPLSGHLFIFFSKRCDRVRIVYWDRNGYAMWTKRLEKGRFRPALSKDGRLSS